MAEARADAEVAEAEVGEELPVLAGEGMEEAVEVAEEAMEVVEEAVKETEDLAEHPIEYEVI